MEAQSRKGQTQMEQGLGFYGSVGFMILVIQTEVVLCAILVERDCRLNAVEFMLVSQICSHVSCLCFPFSRKILKHDLWHEWGRPECQ